VHRFRRLSFLVLLAFVTDLALADEKPLWELGVGVAPMVLPDYRGSDESRGYILPLPYIVYRGEIFRIDRDGIYGRLFETDRVKFDISFDAGVPVNSSKNTARQGMPDLDPVIEIGPSVHVCLWRRCDSEQALEFRLPLRAVFSTNFSSVESIGGTAHPNLNFDLKNLGPHGGWDFGAAAGPLFATERFHDYYYQVGPADVTPVRPAFDARGGYSGMRMTITLSKRFRQVWFGAFARYDDLSGTAFENSPLVRIHRSFMAGFGIAWVLAESEQHVTVRD
jgi:outer membrane protein